MYIVEIKNDGLPFEIQNSEEKLTSGKVIKGINVIDSFSFSLLPSNVGFDKIHDYQTLVSVFNTNTNKYDFYGRVLYSSESMEESGLITKEVICESYLGFLCDSQQPYMAEQNWTVMGLLEHILNTHNSQVEDYKKIQIGTVDVTDNNDNLYLGIQRDNSWKVLKEKLIDKIGGEVRFRVVSGVIYLDYLQKIGSTLTTTIELSKNMQSITKENDATHYISRLIPLGAKIKDEEGNETEERLDITSVNDGKNYIESQEAINAYGIRYETVLFDDVTTASNLLSKGRAYLAENNKVQVKYTVTALDLSLLGIDISTLDVCNYHPIINPLLGINDVARIIKKNIDVCKEVSSTIEIGDNFKTLSDLQYERDKEIDAALGKVQAMKDGKDGKDAAIQSDTEPTDTHYLWLDTSQEPPLMKRYNEETLAWEIINDTSALGVIIVELEESIYSELSKTEETILSKVGESYYLKGDAEALVKDVATQFEQTATDFNFKFSTYQADLEALSNGTDASFQEIQRFIRFEDGKIHLGEYGNELELQIANDRISFQQSGTEVAYFSNNKLYVVDGEFTTSLKLGGFAFLPRNNGNLSFKKTS